MDGKLSRFFLQVSYELFKRFALLNEFTFLLTNFNMNLLTSLPLFTYEIAHSHLPD